MRKGKNYVESAKLIDRTKLYDVNEAIDTMLKTAKAKFDETVEIHIKLGVDSRHADQQVRGAIVLPHGTGKTTRVLVFAKGPKGLMPNPKAGTVTMNVEQAIKDSKAGRIEYRLDKTNIIHCPLGKASFGAEKIQDNFNTLMTAVLKAKPAAAKGQYVRSCVVASTMGPGVKINPAKLTLETIAK